MARTAKRGRAGDGAGTLTSTTRDRELETVRALARILDNDLVDPLIGLVLPWIGDAIGALLGLYIVVLAARRGLSVIVVARMVLNLTVDAVVGAIPLVGDLFDFGFKANRKNLELLTARVATGGRARLGDWALVAATTLGFLGLLGLAIWAVIAVIRSIG